MPQARTVLELLVEENRLEAAIDGYLSLARQHHDDDRKNTGILLSGRYEQLKEQQEHGLIEAEDYGVELARIRYTLLEHVQEMPETWQMDLPPAEPEYTPANSQSQWLKLAALLLVVVVGLAIWSTMLRPKTPETGPQPLPAPTTTQQPATNPAPAPQSAETPPPAAADTRFRSFSKLNIQEDMELGYVGNQYAYRNVRTRQILCCYDKAEPFQNGKARVTTGSQTFFIDKTGNQLENVD